MLAILHNVEIAALTLIGNDMNLADIFLKDLWEEFDNLPLLMQACIVEEKKARYELFRQRYQKNSGIKGGAPIKWPDEQVQEIISRIEIIKETKEYANRKDPREKDMTAYVILIENIFEEPRIIKILEENNLKKRCPKMWQDEIKSVAKAFRQVVTRYKKRT